VNGSHLREQVLSDIAHGVKFDIARLAAGVEVGDLRNRSTAQHADAKKSRFLFHEAVSG
jgi:hypothetical protein